ncbi:MAG: hypothetical protein ACREBU_00085 [Nitrososphaera sp.]
MPVGNHGWATAGALSRAEIFQSLQQFEARPKTHVLYPEQISVHRKFHPIVVMFIGRRGHGKSLAMSTTAHLQQRRYRQHRANFKVLSNYYLAFADYQSPYLVEELTEFPEWGKNAYTCIDEVSGSFPSRRSMARINLNFATLLMQIRKRHCEVVFTTQFPQVMDVQLLLQVDLFVRCESHMDGRAIEMFVYDWWGQWTGKDFRKPWPPETGGHDWIIRYGNTDRMWGQYDTDQVIVPTWLKNRNEILSRTWDLDSDNVIEGEAVKPAIDFTQPRSPMVIMGGHDVIDSWLMSLPDVFSISGQVRIAKQIDPNLSTKSRLADYLEAKGYYVERGQSWKAYFVGDDSDFQRETEVSKKT